MERRRAFRMRTSLCKDFLKNVQKCYIMHFAQLENKVSQFVKFVETQEQLEYYSNVDLREER